MRLAPEGDAMNVFAITAIASFTVAVSLGIPVAAFEIKGVANWTDAHFKGPSGLIVRIVPFAILYAVCYVIGRALGGIWLEGVGWGGVALLVILASIACLFVWFGKQWVRGDRGY